MTESELTRAVGRLSILGAAASPAGLPLDAVLERSRSERTLPVVCRNLGLPCAEERAILALQIGAAFQAREILREIEALPLKGLHLAHRVYPSPGLRDMGDIDLLVRRASLREVDGALRRLGYRPEHDPQRIAAARGGSLNAAVYWREEGLPVHLHWHLSNASLPHFMYSIDMDEVWREAHGGAMAPPHLLVSLCEHALKHSFSTLVHLTDIELASRGADWPLVAETAGRWGLTRAVYYALVLLRDLMGVRSPGLDAVRVGALGWAGESFLGLARRRRWDGLSALGLLSMARGAAAKVRFVREALAPRAVQGLATPGLGGRLGRAVRFVWAGVTP